jgi:hypothetical protein
MKKKVILTILTFMGLLYSGFIHSAIPASERAASIALYNSTNGDGWTNNSDWKTPPLDADGFAMPGTEGGWRGIRLLADHVDSIRLYDNQLSGVIPAQLGNLRYLRELMLFVIDWDASNSPQPITVTFTIKNSPLFGDFATPIELRELPIGSPLDKDRGIFYWQPGPGFLGEFRLVFMETDSQGNLAKKNIWVTIMTRSYGQ